MYVISNTKQHHTEYIYLFTNCSLARESFVYLGGNLLHIIYVDLYIK